MSKARNVLDVTTNIAILCVCILIVVIGTRKFLHLDLYVPAPGFPKAGARMELVGVDWSRANRTLVLALSTRCHFCTESSEFYRRLTPAAISAGIPVVAVFPQPVEEAQEHWEAQKLPLYGLKFVQAKQLPVSGTPTIILVDRSGTVIRTWAGKQQASGEADIIHNLQQ